ncbi:subtype B tannase [Dyadobacter diqingensis]|uniref:subtype B tannase n=1 Tax=Dyadobacter diqingensis TaxID=2938121 RepID=UPI0020C4D913|nr:subtype B tannase [Dyadobacter diqingensis]
MMTIRTGAVAAFICLSGNLFAQKKTEYNLEFNPQHYQTQTLTLDGKTFKVRAFEKIVYVKNPVDTSRQIMNIYIPETYYEGGAVNGYTAETAPIFFPNQIGGYMPAKPATTGNNPMGGMPLMANRPQGTSDGGVMGAGKKQSAVVVAMSKGYVVASAGARGRTTNTGKAPAAIVDLKAAIRYLKFNDQKMPGDAQKIISNGTSAGGAMSSLLGANGDNSDYEPYLSALGAAPASDEIFGVSAYCPITNLDHADMAYEWQFNGINTYQNRRFGPDATNSPTQNTLSEQQIKVSSELKTLFPAYLNSLKLKDKTGKVLTLDPSGNGNFKELIKSYVIASAQKALNQGTDLTKQIWLKIDNGKVTDIDFAAYLNYMERQKTPPAFDALDVSTPENQLFGTSQIDKQHFTDFGVKNSTVAGATKANQLEIKMMNPMNYIGASATKTAAHWRIRHGSKDKDTGLAISVILGTYLLNNGKDVNLELPWDKPHSGDYDLDELFTWADSICK